MNSEWIFKNLKDSDAIFFERNKMKDDIFNFDLEYESMVQKFQSPNYPELNKRIQCKFFMFYMQEAHKQEWKDLKLDWQVFDMNKLFDLIRLKKLPKQYDPKRLSAELQGYLDEYDANGSKSLTFYPLISLRKPSHPKFWESYLDDTNSKDLLAIFKKLIDNQNDNTLVNHITDDMEFTESLSKYID